MIRFIVTALASGLLFYLAVPQIGPAISAARADGDPGIFTAHRQECVQHPGHRSCSWTGRFRADDGRVLPRRVTLYGIDADSLRPGTQTRAIDLGRANRVYTPGGSNEWMLTAFLLLAGTTIAAIGIVPPLRRHRRRDTTPQVSVSQPVG